MDKQILVFSFLFCIQSLVYFRCCFSTLWYEIQSWARSLDAKQKLNIQHDMFRMHEQGKASVAVIAGRKRVHTTFEDQVEMVEEYDIITDELKVRKWKDPSGLRESKWEFEIGEASPGPEEQTCHASKIDINASHSNPIFLCRDTKTAWQWRIRNIPYPENVYQLSIDEQKQEIVLRTLNRKYYKRFSIPEMCRRKLTLHETAMGFQHANNTLIIEYQKPEVVLKDEAQARAQRSKMSSKEGDVDCKQQ